MAPKRAIAWIIGAWVAVGLLFVAVAVPYGARNAAAQPAVLSLVRAYPCGLPLVWGVVEFLRARSRTRRIVESALWLLVFAGLVWLQFFVAP